MERQFNVCDKARVKRYNQEANSEFSEIGKAHRSIIMPVMVGKTVVVVDYSDSHGLCYRVIAPNFAGAKGRDQELDLVWVDPSELESIEPNANPR